jgi:type II secretory pathway component PulM
MIVKCPDGHTVTVEDGVLQTCPTCSVDFRVCPLGHPAQPEARLCPTCGSPLPGGTPRKPPSASSPSRLTPVAPAVLPTPPSLPHTNTLGQQRVASTSGASPPVLAPNTRPIEHRSRKLITGLAIALALVVIIVIVVVAVGARHPKGSPESQTVPGPTSSVSTPTPSVSTSPPPTSGPSAQSEGTDLSNLLTQSTSDRAAIVAAVADISNCGDLQSDASTLDSSASSRQSLLSTLHGESFNALPNGPALVEYLIGAWNNSIASDQSYAQWANDEINNGCSNNDTTDSNFEAAQSTDAASTSAKQHFVTLWNPIASTYGLQTLTPLSF